MSDSAHTVAASPSPGAFRIYAVVLCVGVVCAVAVVTAYELTRPIIELNRVALRKRAILDVLPGATSSAAFRFDPSNGKFSVTTTDTSGSDIVYAGFAENGQLVGLAIEAQGMGYQALIRLLYGYSFDSEAVIGIRVLESRETPGLGDRIETDEAFLSNFDRLDVRLNPDRSEVANTIEIVKPGEKTSGWQIDGITGATISSRAVAEMLGQSTSQWIPRVRGRVADFTAADVTTADREAR